MAAEDAQYGATLAGVDPASLTSALAHAGVESARHPELLVRAAANLAARHWAIARDVARSAVDGERAPVVSPDRTDRRFSDRAWRCNPFLRGVFQSYLASSRTALTVLDALDLPAETRRKARFALGLLLDAASPSNVPFLNPEVVKEAVDTGGVSFARGFANSLEDLATNGGLPRLVDRERFEVGRTLATTPGRVVYRNDLIELLAYEPRKERVFAEPILYTPSWINKYYVLDLAPGRSFVEHAIERGFTVFAVSYRNPDESMAQLTLDDYLRDGVLAALDETERLTGASRVNLVGVCIGGTMAVIALAVLAARGERERVGWATLLNTLVDFADPGEIGAFTDESTIDRIERRMFRRGYMTSDELAGPFTWMKANDLVWRQVVSSWYMGRRPPAFDVLAWNDDSTRLPATMHSQFLRACYLENRLVRPGAFEIDGTPVDAALVDNDLYVLASEDDHIAPWRAAYRTTQLIRGDVRFVLGSGGHIVGMVNPPGNRKASYRIGSELPADPDAWLRGTERGVGSWWSDWADWAAERSGELVAPPALPAGEPAPGSYVNG